MKLSLSARAIAWAITLSSTHALSPRTSISDSYDFVIIGGGQAGLTLGGRLAEDTNHTVLVLEAGGNGDDYRERIDTPAYSYFDSLWTTPLNWGYYTVEQTYADDREIYWPRGKVLGGSSAINGLYLTRPGEFEINAWKDLLGDMDGAVNWAWDSFYAAMKKAENFTGSSEAIASEADIHWNTSTHGLEGPIHASYPGYTFPQVGYWSESLENIGIAISENMYGGENYGAELATSCINPFNWTRSYSRTGYLDPLADNGNYDVLANAYVTRIVFDNSTSADNLTATAVEYTTDNGTTTSTVKIGKEVILTAGTIGSPAILLYSGVGPKDVLSEAGIDLVSELPGVGQHLQDHFSATLTWDTDVETAGSIYYDDGTDKNNTLFLSYIDSAVAYVNSTALYGTNVSSMESTILASIDSYAPNTTYDSVIAGYKAICNSTAKNIFNSATGIIELLFMNSDSNGDIGITAALQHPYSHGRIYINSSNPLDYPVIDPNYLYNPLDYEVLLKGLRVARDLGETAPLSNNLTTETAPGTDVQDDEDWISWIRSEAGTEYHPSSTCAMLPKDLGGVVDANLLVYGLANVRVADASVPPIALSTHLMASTYGVAEMAANIIRGFYNGVPVSQSSGTGDSGSSTVTATGSVSSATGSSSTKAKSTVAPSNGAVGRGSGVWAIYLCLLVCVLGVFV